LKRGERKKISFGARAAGRGAGRMAQLLFVLVLLRVCAEAFVSPYAGRPLAPGPFRHPVSARLCVSENRLLRLENALADLCAAVLHADDIGLLEQHSAGMGRVYLDGSFNMSRAPLLLRAAVRDVMVRHELPMRPMERKWVPRNQSSGESREFLF
jgi:hypothetical protein